MLRRNKE